MTASRQNALDQILDIAGSLIQSSSLTLADEPLGLGSVVSGQTGSAATISAVVDGIATITGMAGFDGYEVGTFLQLSHTTVSDNTGTFLIVAHNSAGSVDIVNSLANATDGYNGQIIWTQRNPYSLSDDLNFERTDRTLIKGVQYYAPVPTYEQGDNLGTFIPANLSNIAGKTTDARGFIVNRAFYNVPSEDGYTKFTISSTGNLRHSDSVNKTGVPCFDTTPYLNDWKACYVEIANAADDNELTVQTGAHKGEKIFGLTNAGSSVSPDSVEVLLYSAPHGSDISLNSTAYSMETGQPSTVSLSYGYFQRLDLMPEESFRVQYSSGITADADLRQDIIDIQHTVGEADGATSLAGLLTNTGTYYSFYDLGTATPSVVQALNTLNAQIGDRTYTAPGNTIITSGQTISASLNVLANAISTASITRVIERLTSSINANTPHTLPGALTYVLDPSNNGNKLLVFTRGVLRDPGPVASGNDYAETSTTQITFYSKLNKDDHINYLIKSA